MIYDVVIVGAGFGGLYGLHKAREAGLKAVIIEAGDGVGGTWYWNRYPGARCDVESREYQFGFSDELQKGWTWSERYAGQPELRAYLNYVADFLKLRPDIRLSTRVTRADFDAEKSLWTLQTEAGESVVAKYCVMATGPLSASRIPDIKGLADFEGESYHTGQWPEDGVDFTGKKVGVIGTGSSGIQAIPLIANEAKVLKVFQRTPNFTMPAMNRPLSTEEIAHEKETLIEKRKRAFDTRGGSLSNYNEKTADQYTTEERIAELESRWGQGGFAMYGSFADTLINPEANEHVSNFVRRKIREAVNDPKVGELLAPNDHPILVKRPCLDTDYLATFNRPHVELVDIRSHPIERITKAGVRTTEREYDLDVIVFATGFDAMTGALLRIDIVGRDGISLREKWKNGPRTYLGLGTAGFPNMFYVVGPGSPSVLTNVVVSIEQQIDWIVDCVNALEARGASAIEPLEDAENFWVDHVNDAANQTLYLRAATWYLGANIPGKPRVFMPYVGGLGNYGKEINRVAEAGYEGFRIS